MEEYTQQNITERVNERLAGGIKIEFDSFFSTAWKIFKKVTFMIAGVSIMLAFPIFIIYVIMMPFLFGVSSFNQYLEIIKENPYYFQELQRSPLYLVKQWLFALIIGLLFIPFQAGMIRICRDADKGEELKFRTIFTYYKSAYLGKLLALIFITTTVSSSVNLALSFIPFFGRMLYLLIVVFGYVLLAYTQTLVIFGNASVGKAFSLSYKLGIKTFFPVLGYSLLCGLLWGLGFAACCIGAIFTMAFIPICQYLLYKYAVGFPEDENNNPINGETPHWLDTPPSAG